MHGADYDMGVNTFATTAGCSAKDAFFQLSKFHSAFPNIRAWHESIRQQLSINRTLVTPFGRKRTFYGYWGDSMFKEAYANVPQGTACDHINMAALRIDAQTPKDVVIVMQVHDELVIEHGDHDPLPIAKLFKKEVEVPVTVNFDTLVIPLDVGVGKDWKNVKDYTKEELL
jgi:DNA polymerase I-like protein with 3'-5' exonuclease and polymerase domains